MKAVPFSKAEVLKTIAKIIERGAVFEVRALDAQLFGNRRTVTVSGYFDNADACVTELEKLTAAKGVYITANPVHRALLARCANRLDYAEKNATTNDQHILQRCSLPIDVDPDRPSGISSSRDEKEAAKNKAREIYRYLKARGWAEPVVADSGNGFHLLYRVDLPSVDDGLVERLLAALANRFDGDGVKLDRSVYNPARIIRLYGTWAAKGDDTKERPHRLSRILIAPETLQVVSAEQLRALVDELQPEQHEPKFQQHRRRSMLKRSFKSTQSHTRKSGFFPTGEKCGYWRRARLIPTTTGPKWRCFDGSRASWAFSASTPGHGKRVERFPAAFRTRKD